MLLILSLILFAFAYSLKAPHCMTYLPFSSALLSSLFFNPNPSEIDLAKILQYSSMLSDINFISSKSSIKPFSIKQEETPCFFIAVITKKSQTLTPLLSNPNCSIALQIFCSTVIACSREVTHISIPVVFPFPPWSFAPALPCNSIM